MKENAYHVALALAVLISATAVSQEGVAQSQQVQTVETVQEDAEIEAQVDQLASKLRCPTCRALSVQDSPSGMAQEMRVLIREQLKAGKTPAEVEAYFVERYGEWILLKPKASGFNWTVWLLPIVMLAGGLVFVYMTARRWVAQGQQQATLLAEEERES